MSKLGAKGKNLFCAITPKKKDRSGPVFFSSGVSCRSRSTQFGPASPAEAISASGRDFGLRTKRPDMRLPLARSSKSFFQRHAKKDMLHQCRGAVTKFLSTWRCSRKAVPPCYVVRLFYPAATSACHLGLCTGRRQYRRFQQLCSKSQSSVSCVRCSYQVRE